MTKEHGVLTLFIIYFAHIAIAALIGFGYPMSLYGVVSLMVLGLPWSVLGILLFGITSHNSSLEGVVFLFLFCTVPNIALSLIWVAKLHIQQSVAT